MGKGAAGAGFDQAPAEIAMWTPVIKSRRIGWTRESVDTSLHGIHGLEVVDWNGNGRTDLLAASLEGITLLQSQLNDGRLSWKKLRSHPETNRGNTFGHRRSCGWPPQGRSKILAAIEPWHGDHVAVYRPVRIPSGIAK